MASIAEKKKALQLFMNKANKDAKGRPVLAMANDVPNTFLLRRPSGIMQLDVDLGGGLPAGGISYISGPDNSGKTLLLWKFFAMQQRLHGNNCILGYAPTEAAPDYFMARKCGVKVAIPDSMIDARNQQRKESGLPGLTKEEIKELKTQVGEFVIFRGATGEELLDNVLDGIDKNIFNILAIDSISGLIPSSQLELDSVGDFGQQGAQAIMIQKFMNKYCPKTLGLEGPNETTVIMTAQVRANRKKSEMPSYMAKWEQEWATTGGWSGRHTKLVDLTVWSGSFDKEKDKSGTKHVIGKTMNWKLTKGKAGTHDGITGEVELIYNYIGQEMDIRSLIGPGIRYGAILEKDGLLTVPGVAPLQDIAGPERLAEKLLLDFNTELEVRRRILTAAKVECVYT